MSKKNIGLIKYIGFLIILLFGTQLKAQQDPGYTQYMHNPLTINPAYAGSADMLSAIFLARKQWVGFAGAPETRVLTLSAPITNNNFGAGFSYVNDKLGPLKQNSFYMDISHHIKINQKGILALGLKGGFDMIQLNLMNLKLNNNNDDSFSRNYNENFSLNFGCGLYYYTPKFFLGISIPRMLRKKYRNDGNKTKSLGYSERHYFITTGALFDLNDNIKFKPTILSKIVLNAPISIDLSGNFIFNDILWLGAAYRIDDSMSFMVNYQLTNQIRVGYSFDLTKSELRRYNNGTHEIMIAFDFQFNKKKVMTPRYF